MFFHRGILACAVVAFVCSVEILLDDAGQHIRPGAEWTKAEGNCAQGGHGGSFHHNNGVHNGDSFATWNFSIAKDGCYWVEEFHPDTSHCDFSLSSKVPVHIHFCRGLQTAGLVDQSQRAGQWNKLVRLPFYTTHTAAIHIAAMGFEVDAAGVWAADAFRLTWDSETCHDSDAESDEAVSPAEEAAEAMAAAKKTLGIAPTDEEVQAKPVTAVEEGTEREEKAVVAPNEEAQLPLLQALVDDADAVILGADVQPVAECPATAGRTFHHDGLNRDRRAQATFEFNPPHDGCYLIEELHPQLEKCQASPNTKVHVNFCKGLKAVGTVNQTFNGGQWTFLAALPFYAGHPGNVTLSNEGTPPNTLAMFDQVRFTWSGKSCGKVDSHPRNAEIRITVDFKTVADRRIEFGNSLRTKLAELAKVPEKALRLTGLRPGSIIAEFLVMPSAVDDPLTEGLNARQIIEKLQGVVATNAPDLCGLTGASLETCKVEFKDLGVAKPSIRPVRQPQEESEDKVDPKKETGISFLMIKCLVATAWFVISIVLGCCFAALKKRKTVSSRVESDPDLVDATQAKESEVTTSMEEGNAVEEKKPVEDDLDNNSTLAPSSDKQSEASLNGDIENNSDPDQDLAVVKALSDQNL